MLGLLLLPVPQFCVRIGTSDVKAQFLSAYKWHSDQIGFVEAKLMSKIA